MYHSLKCICLLSLFIIISAVGTLLTTLCMYDATASVPVYVLIYIQYSNKDGPFFGVREMCCQMIK